MINLALTRRDRRAGARKFIPDSLEANGVARLESRLMAAATIFRRPPSDPNNQILPPDAATATANGQASSSASTADVTGTASAGTISSLGKSGAHVVDTPNFDAPLALVGVSVASFNTSNELTVTGQGFLNTGASSSIHRNYVLANTVAPPPVNPPASTLIETFQAHYTCTNPNAGILVANATLTTPAMTINCQINGLTINNTFIQATASTSGTIAGARGPISYSYGVTRDTNNLITGFNVYVTSTANVGVLAQATRPVGAPLTMTGLAWGVDGGTSVGGPHINSNQMRITSVYNASFAI